MIKMDEKQIDTTIQSMVMLNDNTTELNKLGNMIKAEVDSSNLSYELRFALNAYIEAVEAHMELSNDTIGLLGITQGLEAPMTVSEQVDYLLKQIKNKYIQ